MKRINLVVTVALTVALIMGSLLLGPSPALADDCVGITPDKLDGFINISGECEITGLKTKSGTFNLDETLHITATGKIDASGGGITLNITGDLLMDTGAVIEANDDAGAACNSGPDHDNACPITIIATGTMEMQAGSSILAENNCAGGGPCGGGSGGNITIKVGGDLILHGTIPNGPLGALISSRKTTGAGDTGHGGDIFIEVGNVTVDTETFLATCDEEPKGDILLEKGSQILADANGEAGAIRMFAGHDITIRGTVSSRGFTTLGRGGPITIDACCNILIDDDGKVSSRGQDPGADLVHIEGCCVKIFGLVESTGPGHTVPSGTLTDTHRPDNLCAGSTVRPGKPLNSTACVEVWSGTDLEINSTGLHRGQINADTDFGGGTNGIGWIDLLANHDIKILDGTGNDSDDPHSVPIGVFAVHANQGSGDGCHGGLVNVQSKKGTVTENGLALQAEAIGATGCKGGQITVEAKLGVTLDGASLFARGGHWDRNTTPINPAAAGGKIFVTTFGGALSWQGAGSVGDVRPTGTIVPAAQDGKITLKDCAGVAGINTTGSSFPANNNSPDAGFPSKQGGPCVGTEPTFPQPAEPGGLLPDIPSDTCQDACNPPPPSGGKTGRKFNDTNKDGTDKDANGNPEPGLAGFRIHLFNDDLSVHLHDITSGTNGDYAFPNLLPGTYTACEEQQPGFTQSFPPATSRLDRQNPLDACTNHAANMASEGYTFTLAEGELDSGNDFGNFPTPCEKLPIRTVLDPTFGRFPDNLGPDVIVRLDLGQKVQDAVDKATDSNGDGYIIILVVKDNTGKLGGSTTENVVISKPYEERFALLACSVTVHALDAKLPAGHIMTSASSPFGSPENIFVMDLHGADSGLAGWLVEGDGRYIRNVANTNNATGISFVGNGNTMHNGNAVGNSGVGIQVNGNGNSIETPDSFANGGCGIQVTGNSNSVDGADVGDKGKGNLGGGICVTGDSNILSENDVFANTGTGISVAGKSNQLPKNNVGDVKEKTNTGDGINVVGDSNQLSENDVYNNGGNGISVTGNTNTFLKNVVGDAKKGNGLDGFHVAGAGNALQENKASANGVSAPAGDGDGFDISGGTAGSPNTLKSNQSNSGSSGGSGENKGAEYRLLGYVKNNGGGNKADGATVPSGSKCATTFPATNATVLFSPAAVCE